MHDVDRLVAGIAPDPGPGMTPGAMELFEEITTAPAAAPGRPAGLLRSGIPRRRRWAVLSAIGVATAAAVLASWSLPGGLGPAPASATLDIERDGDHYVITVKDLFAEPELYERELKARGLDITLKLVPTSPGGARGIYVFNDVDRLRAGEPVPADGPITTIEAPGPCERLGGCPTGLKVPVDYAKKAEVTLGREARPGEAYVIRPIIDMPGEPLHCVEYVNKTVAEVVPMLRERGVEPELTSFTASGRVPPGHWYVHDGVMSAAGEAIVLTGPEPAPNPRPVGEFCPKGS
ncbi:hypothetical protein Ppa06_35980 [Planomonospora parontospora subsp. parontospora]|uniref:Uncharacterized protein n=2 Tax=Planomonospora parontospora TaxID=58119 RepID=A0AA37F536_9ACTN|nr:hypothetical protein [Planomonospora parontospora]GGK70521.1 hypothetical protein GCM10010126_32460 [Planomonospora parontospora]GII09800.1 hypothetical protein Ppa06_35980 [Planomonospora parontospora subsp. parontospora]